MGFIDHEVHLPKPTVARKSLAHLTFIMSIALSSVATHSVRGASVCSRCLGHLSYRSLHASSPTAATPFPITATGPPPSAPIPAASQYGERVDRRRRQAQMLQRGQEHRMDQANPCHAMKRRFWKDVTVQINSGRRLRTTLLWPCAFKQHLIT